MKSRQPREDRRLCAQSGETTFGVAPQRCPLSSSLVAKLPLFLEIGNGKSLFVCREIPTENREIPISNREIPTGANSLRTGAMLGEGPGRVGEKKAWCRLFPALLLAFAGPVPSWARLQAAGSQLRPRARLEGGTPGINTNAKRPPTSLRVAVGSTQN